MLRRAREGWYKIIYVAPERLEMPGFQRFAQEREISMVTVDEAHCISQWGQDFRPSYLKIVEFIKNLPKRPIVSAFTATATEEVKNDILCTLSLEDPEVVITGFDRKNLYYSVENIRRKDEFIMEYIEKHPTESGIIYCATRKNVDNLFELLFQKGVAVTRYHAGLNNETRKKNQEDFIYDRTPVIIATLPSCWFLAPIRFNSVKYLNLFSNIVSVIIEVPFATANIAPNIDCISVGNPG